MASADTLGSGEIPCDQFFVDFVDSHLDEREGDAEAEFLLFVEDQFVPVDRVTFARWDGMEIEPDSYLINLFSPLLEDDPIVQITWNESKGFYRNDGYNALPVDEERVKMVVDKLKAAESARLMIPSDKLHGSKPKT